MKPIVSDSGNPPTKKKKKEHAHICFADEPKRPTEDDNEHTLSYGLVKVGHVYQTQFVFHSSVTADKPHAHQFPSSSLTFEFLRCEITVENDGVVKLKALRPGVVNETISFVCPACKDNVEIVVTAKIMGSNSGTPSLKEGVHCIESFELPSDDEQDSSCDEK